MGLWRGLFGIVQNRLAFGGLAQYCGENVNRFLQFGRRHVLRFWMMADGFLG